jgi:galactokinase
MDTAVSWSNYVRGVTAVFQQSGCQLQGFDGLIHSTIPFGSGLSSSAALEMATAVLFNTLGNLNIDPVNLALMCQRAENEFVGMNCGILDQYSSAMGQQGSTLLLDCRRLISHTQPIAPGITLVICDTKTKRALTGSEYPERRAQCEEGARILAGFYPHVTALRDVTHAHFTAHEADLPELIAKRCRFIIEENERVFALADALAEGDRERIGGITAVSFSGARDLYEITCTEMEQMMTAMLNGPGIIGARQAGAGFGGCMAAFVENDNVAAFIEHIQVAYKKASGITPDVYPVQAAAGAGVLEELN